MKSKIIAELKTTYAKMGLSDEAFDGVASLLEKTVKEDSEIATAVGGDDVANLLKTIQGQIDSWKNKFYDSSKALDEYKKLHPDTKPNPEEGEGKADPAEPEWAKKLREQNEAILAAQAKREKDEKDATTLASVKSALEKAGCTNAGILNLTLKGFALKENEKEEDAVKRVTEEYNANIKATFGEGVVPPAGGGTQTPDAKAAREAHNEYLRKRGLLPKEETTN
jgi:hypothetical protein